MKTTNSIQLKSKLATLPLAVFMAFNLSSCTDKTEAQEELVQKQVVSQSVLNNVRLADGVPLSITLSTRWLIENKKAFDEKFNSHGYYDSLILQPRQLELANGISNQYDNVDSVFTVQRHAFINDLKVYITENLGEEGVTIEDVIVAKVEFPVNYTNAKETLALQEQELKRIRKQSVIDLEMAEASKSKAIAQGAVNVEQAKLNAELESINAKTEESRRKSTLARAETEKLVNEKRAQSEARRQVLLAEADAEKQKLYAAADLDKKEKLKNLEVQKQIELNKVALEKEEKREKMLFAQQVQMADLCNKNPNYASYLINKELANNVQIAVLPADQDASVFQNLLNNSMAINK